MTTEDVMKALEPIAKGIGIAVSELWKIFTRQYFIKGVSQLFAGIVSGLGTYFLGRYLIPIGIVNTVLVVAGVIWSLMFFYSAIPLLFNPQYFALNDIIEKIKGVKKGSSYDSDDDY